MFVLKLYDRKGTELKPGDIVKISDGRRFTFFCEVKYLEAEKILTPFHTFSFHSFEKIDKLPDNVLKSTEERYSIWYVSSPEAEEDVNAEDFEYFLMSWRRCENLLQTCWKVELMK